MRNVNAEPEGNIFLFLRTGDPRSGELLLFQVYFYFLSESAAKKVLKNKETTHFKWTPCCLCNCAFVFVEVWVKVRLKLNCKMLGIMTVLHIFALTIGNVCGSTSMLLFKDMTCKNVIKFHSVINLCCVLLYQMLPTIFKPSATIGFRSWDELGQMLVLKKKKKKKKR